MGAGPRRDLAVESICEGGHKGSGQKETLVVSLCLGNEGMKRAVESVPGTKQRWRCR